MTRTSERDGSKPPSVPIPLEDLHFLNLRREAVRAKPPSIPIPLQDRLILLSDLDLTVDDFSRAMTQIPLPELELVILLPLEKLLVLQIFCTAGLCCSTEGQEHLSVILDDHTRNQFKKMEQFQLFAFLPVIYALIKFRGKSN